MDAAGSSSSLTASPAQQVRLDGKTHRDGNSMISQATPPLLLGLICSLPATCYDPSTHQPSRSTCSSTAPHSDDFPSYFIQTVLPPTASSSPVIFSSLGGPQASGGQPRLCSPSPLCVTLDLFVDFFSSALSFSLSSSLFA